MTTTILPTNNQTWGYWGTIGHQHVDRHEAWALATTAIAKATGGTPEAVRAFLDSRHGRHFADEVANGLFTGLTLAAAIDAAVATWMGWRIGTHTEREHGIPRDLPYLTGWVTHCAIMTDTTE
jgi:hypothetical protein